MTHYLFCEKFDEKTKNFCCINSWGDFNLPNPKIHSSRICAVDYIGIINITPKAERLKRGGLSHPAVNKRNSFSRAASTAF